MDWTVLTKDPAIIVQILYKISRIDKSSLLSMLAIYR